MNDRIALADVSLRRHGRTVLDNVSMGAGVGQVMGIIGPNGAGKSTALRVMAGLLSPEKGEVLLDGEALDARSAEERARTIGYLEQSAEVHWPLSARAVVELGRLPFRQGWFGSDPDGARLVDKAMNEADVRPFERRLLSELSGGEAMRVLIARVLASEPDVILADEPVAALDINHQLQVMELLSERARNGVTVVIVLHDLALAARFCDRLVLMNSGSVVRSGESEYVLEPQLLENVYNVQMRLVEPEEGVCVPIPWQRRNRP